jgi:hypothetical protein
VAISDIIPSVSWPAGFDPITFSVPSYLYYSKSNSLISGVTYLQGYNISSNVSFFGVSFVVTANFTTQGVVVNAACPGAINLGFVDFVGYTEPGPPQVTYAGPSVQINTLDPKNVSPAAGLLLVWPPFSSVLTMMP